MAWTDAAESELQTLQAAANGRVFGDEKGGEHEGVPDGIKVDEHGNLFVTGPKGIWVGDSQGHHLGTIEMPEQPANLTWGDEDYHTLYITARTAVDRLPARVRGFLPYLAKVIPGRKEPLEPIQHP
jgi:gluconolactonase